MIQGIGLNSSGEHRGREIEELVASLVGEENIFHAHFWQALGNIGLRLPLREIPYKLTRALQQWCALPSTAAMKPSFHYLGADERGQYQYPRLSADNALQLHMEGHFQTPTAFPQSSVTLDETRILRPEEILRTRIEVLPLDLRIARYFVERPDAMYRDLTPRQFEELVAALLEPQGFKVRLTPPGRDGGVDIFAERQSPLDAPELVIVQCKRNRPDRRVGEPVVKQLLTDVDIRDATRGLIATTSTFSKHAASLIKRFKYRLDGADQGRLQDWMLLFLNKDDG